MSSPFPLLRLPRLVLFDVFKSLSIGEKINLSLCSKKISTQINNARLYSQKVIVNLDFFNQEIIVHSENYQDTFQVSIHPDSEISQNPNTQQCSMLCSTVIVNYYLIGIETFWKNHREGFLSVIRHLLKMFQGKISTKSSCFDSDLFQPTIAMLFDLQLEFKRLFIRFTGSKDEKLLWNQISRNLGLVEDLLIVSVGNPDFRPVFTLWPQTIYITYPGSAWFTVEHLLACTCTTIKLCHSRLENKEMDQVLRKWKAGELPNLKHLTIISLKFKDNGEHILGINFRELHGMVIQTDDGSKTATIKLNFPCIEMSVTPIK